MLTLTVDQSDIVAVTPYQAKDILKSIPGGRWVPDAKAWKFPASPLTARKLIDGLAEYGVDEAVERLASRWVTVPEIVERVNGGEDVKVSRLMRYEPRSNQRIGAVMLREMTGSILGWGMGSGKSYATLSCFADHIEQFLDNDREGPIPMFFLSAPTTVVAGVWPSEISKHLVDWRSYLEVSAMPKGTSTAHRVRDASRKLKYAEEGRKAFLFIVGHESCWRPPISNFVTQHTWDVSAIDEIHRVETPGAKVTRWVDMVLTPRSKKRVGLTGTLFRKNELDAFCPIRFVEPAIFGRNASKFKNEHADLNYFNQPEAPKDPEFLRDQIGLVTHFVRTRDVVDLPPVYEIERVFPMSKEGRENYDSMEKDSVLQVEEGTLTASNGLTRLLRLQQITSGFLKVETADGTDQGVQVDTSKRDALEDYMTDLPVDEPVVVFTMFKSDVRCVRHVCKNLGREVFELTGDADELKQWQEDTGPSVMVANIQSAGVGVDMTRACYAVFFSCGFSHPNYDQACRRLDRPGQDKTVTIAHMIAENTVDRVVVDTLKERGNGIEAAISYLREQYRQSESGETYAD